jgi:hypothetical protein
MPQGGRHCRQQQGLPERKPLGYPKEQRAEWRGRLRLRLRLPEKQRVLSVGVTPERPGLALPPPEPSPLLPEPLLQQSCLRAGKPKGKPWMLREELRRWVHSARREPLE